VVRAVVLAAAFIVLNVVVLVDWEEELLKVQW
jgi:hypothetical protein